MNDIRELRNRLREHKAQEPAPPLKRNLAWTVALTSITLGLLIAVVVTLL